MVERIRYTWFRSGCRPQARWKNGIFMGIERIAPYYLLTLKLFTAIIYHKSQADSAYFPS